MPDYGRLAAEFYDIDKPEPQPDAFEFYADQIRQASREGPVPVLEPMCGSGRFLLPLIAAGFDVEGVDTSGPMLAACRERAAQRGLQARLSQQNLESLELERQFRLAFIPNGSFCLLTEPASIEQSLKRLHAALEPGGMLLLELERLQPQEPVLSGTWGGRWLECADGSKIVLSWLSQYSGRADVTSSLHRYERIRSGRVVETEWEDFNVKSYSEPEARAFLEKSGFVEIQAFKPYVACAADERDEAWIFAARRAISPR